MPVVMQPAHPFDPDFVLRTPVPSAHPFDDDLSAAYDPPNPSNDAKVGRPAFDRLYAARERQNRAEARISDARQALIVSAVTAPITGLRLDEWVDAHTRLMLALVAENNARVVADDDARRALAQMKGGAP